MDFRICGKDDTYDLDETNHLENRTFITLVLEHSVLCFNMKFIFSVRKSHNINGEHERAYGNEIAKHKVV